MTRQNPTAPDALHVLSPTMERAVDLLATGVSATDASAACGVTRQTVTGWKNHHPGFIAALNSRRLELNAERADRIRALDYEALTIIAEKLGEKDGDTALAWVRARPLHWVDIGEVGSLDAGSILDAEASRIQAASGTPADVLMDAQHSMSHSRARAVAEAAMLEALGAHDPSAQ